MNKGFAVLKSQFIASRFVCLRLVSWTVKPLGRLIPSVLVSFRSKAFAQSLYSKSDPFMCVLSLRVLELSW